MRYLIYGEQAESRGLVNTARLFRSIAFAEYVHARNHLELLEDIGDTGKNLSRSIRGEQYELEEMYPAFDLVAKMHQDHDSVQSIHYAIEAEKNHALLYGEASRALAAGRDYHGAPIHICPACGSTAAGERARACPVCGQPGQAFIQF
ncbi:rubrerythrin family protein [bacterium]|nr:rubrerythrin family protein [bacterium]